MKDWIRMVLRQWFCIDFDVFVGLLQDDKPVKWRIENSWNSTGGDSG